MKTYDPMRFRIEDFGPLRKWTAEDHPFPFTPMFHRIRPEPLADPHDHPFAFNTFVLHGWYVEEVFDLRTGQSYNRTLAARDSQFVPSGHVHRVVECAEETYTLILPNGVDRRWAHYRFFREGYDWRPHDGPPEFVRYRDVSRISGPETRPQS